MMQQSTNIADDMHRRP